MTSNTAWFRHFRSRIPEPQSVEELVQDEQEVRQIAELTAGLMIIISPKRAEKVFGKYFPVFWETYAVHDFDGMEKATVWYRHEGKRYVKEWQYPDLHRQGLEAMLQDLEGKGQPNALRAPVYFLKPYWTRLYEDAKEFGDQKLLAKVRAAMERYAGEVLAGIVRPEKDQWFEDFKKRHKEAKAKKHRNTESRDFDLGYTAMSLFRAGWNSNPHQLLKHMEYFENDYDARKYHGVQCSRAQSRTAYLAIFDSAFCRFEEDDKRPMEAALRMLTGKKGKNLRRLTEITYTAILGSSNWECWLNALKGYLYRAEHRRL